MDIGNFIRFHRIKNSLTQQELANGICSIPYLSKVENNNLAASEDILNLLCDRLEVTIESIKGGSFVKSLEDWYCNILNNDLDKATSFHEENYSVLSSNVEPNSYLLFNLFCTRYELVLGNIEKAKEYLNTASLYKGTFNDELSFHYHVISGFMLYMEEKFNQSYESFSIAERIAKEKYYEDWKIADLYYLLGISGSRIRKVNSAIYYTEKALQIYKEQYNFDKSAKCHILIGICLGRVGQYEDAKTNYLLAKKVAELVNNNSLLAVISHNLGYQYSKLEEYELAQKEYLTSLSLTPEKQIKETLETIHCIVINLYKLENYDECLTWINKGVKLINNDEKFISFTLHFSVYEKLINNTPPEEFITFMKDIVLPHFKQKQQDNFVVKYSTMLGNHYMVLYKYKDASKYLSNTIELFKQNPTLGGVL